MFTENPAAFLPDFGVSVTWYGAPWAIDRVSGATLDSSKFPSTGVVTQTALAFFDKPDMNVLANRVSTRDYKIRFPSTQFVGIKVFHAIVIATKKYMVKELNSLDDGTWSVAELETV